VNVLPVGCAGQVPGVSSVLSRQLKKNDCSCLSLKKKKMVEYVKREILAKRFEGGHPPRAIRFCEPYDHRATRPGFQAPWGSHDPTSRIKVRRVFWAITWMSVLGVLASEALSYVLIPNPPSHKTSSPEWLNELEKEERKLDALE